MSEPLLQLLKTFAAMTPADRKAVEIRLGAPERAALRKRLQPNKKLRPAAPVPMPRYNFEAYSPHVAKRLAEILVIGKTPAGATEATKVALAALVPSSTAPEGQP